MFSDRTIKSVDNDPEARESVELFPFEYVISNSLRVHKEIFLDWAVEAGYLTKEYKPTAFCLREKLLFINDGSRQFKALAEPPVVLASVYGIFYIYDHFCDDHS